MSGMIGPQAPRRKPFIGGIAIVAGSIVALLVLGACGRGDPATDAPFPGRDAPGVARPTAEATSASGSSKRARRRATVRSADANSDEALATPEPECESSHLVGRINDSVTVAAVPMAVVRIVRCESVPAQDPLEIRGEDEARIRAGSDGAFEYLLADSAPRFLVVSAPGFLDRAVVATGDGSPFLISLRRGGERRFQVRSDEGEPLAGARVEVVANSWNHTGSPYGRGACDDNREFVRTRAVCDGGGRVLLEIADDDRFVVRAPGFASREFWPSAEAPLPDVLELRRARPIAGIAVDDLGRPVVGATVKADSSPAATVLTDSDGTFRLDEIDPENGCVTVEVEREGLVGSEAWVNPGDLDARFLLPRACAVEIDLVRSDGGPIGDVEFDVDEPEDVDCDSDVEGGRFRLDGLPPGEHVITARASEGERRFTGQVVVRCEAEYVRRGVRVELRERARSCVAVRLVGPNGEPVRCATRTIHGTGSVDHHPAEGYAAALSDVTDEAPGTAMIVTFREVRVGDVAFPDMEVPVVTRATGGGDPDLVTLPRPAELAIRVLFDEGQWSKATVGLTPRGESLVRPRQNGSSWTISADETYRLSVAAKGFARVERDVTQAEMAAGVIEQHLRLGATVRARIVAETPGVLVEPWFVLSPAGQPGHDLDTTQFAEDGSCSIETVPPGPCVVTVSGCDAFIQRTFTIDVPDGGELDLGDVVVPGAVRLKGRVLTADGRAGGGADVSYADGSGDTMETTTLSDGTFEVDVPRGGTGDLFVSKRGHGLGVVPLDGKAAFTEARLAEECSVRVIVRSAPDWLESSDVRVRRPGGVAEWSPPSECRAYADGSRSFDLHGLAPGRWVVLVRDAQAEVEVVAGDRNELTLDCQR